MAHIIKLDKKESILSVIKKIKDLKETEVIFELEKGALLLKSSANLKLMRKTGETLGKTIKVKTSDELGRILSAKAGVLLGGEEADTRQLIQKTTSIRPKIKPNFSDIRATSKILPSGTAKTLVHAFTGEKLRSPIPISGKFRSIVNWTLLVAVGLVIIGLFLALVLPTATITLYARSEPVTRDLEITVDKGDGSDNGSRLTIPGTLINREVSETENFAVSGTSLEGTKATGSVTLFNFTPNTYILRASTTILVADGKEFVFTSDVSGIRPTTGTNESDADPASLIPPVEVVAVNVGDTFNLPVNTKFEIKNEALGNVPKVFAVNTQAFEGGSSSATLVLTQADVDQAKLKIIESIRVSLETELSQEAGGNVKLLTSGLKTEILAEATDVEIGEPTEEFDLTMIVRISGLAFNEDEATDLITSQIKSVLSEDKYILSDAKQAVVASFKSLDLESGRGILTVHFETVVAYKVDDENLSQLLAGKSATEIKEILLTKPEVDRVDVQFSPFFVNRAPRFSNKVKINTILSTSGF
ncbi:MAG: hypothetical protein HYW51_01820 [Candidatus Doudnabacteria bacterium]|nr:hypothetical protein [Candidatus Doudnabacteria bacterium]